MSHLITIQTLKLFKKAIPDDKFMKALPANKFKKEITVDKIENPTLCYTEDLMPC